MKSQLQYNSQYSREAVDRVIAMIDPVHHLLREHLRDNGKSILSLTALDKRDLPLLQDIADTQYAQVQTHTRRSERGERIYYSLEITFPPEKATLANLMYLAAEKIKDPAFRLQSESSRQNFIHSVVELAIYSLESENKPLRVELRPHGESNLLEFRTHGVGSGVLRSVAHSIGGTFMATNENSGSIHMVMNGSAIKACRQLSVEVLAALAGDPALDSPIPDTQLEDGGDLSVHRRRALMDAEEEMAVAR